MRLTPELIDAYRRTSYRVDAPHRFFVIRIDGRHPDLDDWLQSAGVIEWAYVTAWNPRSTPLPADENASRHARLCAAVDALGLPFWEGEGSGDELGWAPERSLFIGGISADQALELGRRFEQHAVVVGRAGEPAVLMFPFPEDANTDVG